MNHQNIKHDNLFQHFIILLEKKIYIYICRLIWIVWLVVQLMPITRYFTKNVGYLIGNNCESIL